MSSSYYTLAQIYGLVEYGEEGVTIFEGNGRRGREEVISYAAFFSSSRSVMTQKRLPTRQGMKMYFMMIEDPPQTSLPLIALENVYSFANFNSCFWRSRIVCVEGHFLPTSHPITYAVLLQTLAKLRLKNWTPLFIKK